MTASECARCDGTGVVEDAPDPMPVGRAAARLWSERKVRLVNGRPLKACPCNCKVKACSCRKAVP